MSWSGIPLAGQEAAETEVGLFSRFCFKDETEDRIGKKPVAIAVLKKALLGKNRRPYFPRTFGSKEKNERLRTTGKSLLLPALAAGSAAFAP